MYLALVRLCRSIGSIRVCIERIVACPRYPKQPKITSICLLTSICLNLMYATRPWTYPAYPGIPYHQFHSPPRLGSLTHCSVLSGRPVLRMFYRIHVSGLLSCGKVDPSTQVFHIFNSTPALACVYVRFHSLVLSGRPVLRTV